MAKTLFYRLFGIGKIPDDRMEEFRSEGLLFYDEGIRATVTYLNFRGSGRYSDWKRQWFGASIVITQKRIVAFRRGHVTTGMEFDDPRLKQMTFSIEEPETLLVEFDATVIQPDWKGRIEYRFRTPIARDIVQHLNNQ